MEKIDNEPHVSNRFDLRTVRKCGAKTRNGSPCRQPAMKNGRCRLHGGKSTGPKTQEGLERSRKANWKHGFYSAEAKEERRTIRRFLRECKNFIKEIK